MTHSKFFVGHVYNLKTVQNSNYWHFGGNRLLLLTKKCTYEKWTKNLKLSLRLKPADTRSNNN